MERMIESRDIKHMACVERIKQLEEENKKLKEETKQDIQDINSRYKESEKLKIQLAKTQGERDGLKMVVERLHKEIEEQEAEGGGLFDEIDYRKREAKRLGWKPNK